MSRRALAFAASLSFVLGWIAPEARADEPSSQLVLDVEGAFTDELTSVESGLSVALELQNRGGRPRSIDLEITSRRFRSAELRFRRHVDLNAGTRRVVLLDLPNVAPSSSLDVVAREGGRELARTSDSVIAHLGQGMVLVLARAPRLVAAWHDLAIVETETYSSYGSSNERHPVEVATPRVSAQSGEPMLPSNAFGYASIAMVVTTPDELARLDDEARAALDAFVETGGTLWIGLARPTDVEREIVRSFVGRLVASPAPDAPGAEVAVRAAPRFAFAGEGAEPAAYGTYVARGHGRIVLTPFDPNDASFASDPDVRRLGISLLEHGADHPQELTVRRPGRGVEVVDLASSDFRGAAESTIRFQDARNALDAGAERRPPMFVVAMLVLGYVLIIGPLASRMARTRARPLFPLVFVPAAALVFLVLLLGIGVATRGLADHARVVRWLDAGSGSRVFVDRSYVGLHVGRPRALTVASRPGERLAVLVEPDRTDHGVLELNGAGGRVRDLPLRFWDTVFLRRERILTLGDGITIEAEAGHVTRVHNRTGLTLHHAVVLDAAGRRSLGEIAAGATIERTSSVAEPQDRSRFEFWSRDGTNQRALLDALGIDGATRPLALGAFTANRGIGVVDAPISLIAVVAIDPSVVPPGFGLDGSFAVITVDLDPEPPRPSLPRPYDIEEAPDEAIDVDAGAPDAGSADGGEVEPDAATDAGGAP